MHFLWFKDVSNDEFEVQCYKINRVPFGMRFSATLLMMALYIILVRDRDPSNNPHITQMMYNLSYVDNLAYSSSSEEELSEAFDRAKFLFNSYGFKLQKFSSNSNSFNSKLKTNGNFTDEDTVDLFGVL